MLFGYVCTCLYRMFLEERAVRRDNVPEVKLHRYEKKISIYEVEWVRTQLRYNFKRMIFIVHLLYHKIYLKTMKN